MEESLSQKLPRRVLWAQLGALAAVQGAITLMWVIYGAYIPQLLKQAGYSPDFAVILLAIEQAIAVFLEPFFGSLSDRDQHHLGTRFPWISLGVILSGGLFLLLPAVVFFNDIQGGFSAILPGVAVLWAIAMTMFRAPAIVLLGKYAAPSHWPLAASFLICAGGLIGAFRPIANKALLELGPVVTFGVGSFVLLGAAWTLRFFDPPESPNPEPVTDSWSSALPQLAQIALTGVGIAIGVRFGMDALQKALKAVWGLSGSNFETVMVGFGILLAIAALPAGTLAVRWGNSPAMVKGIGAIIGCFLLLLLPHPATLGLVLLGLLLPWNILLNGAIPFALSGVPASLGGLGIGVYFGGFSGAMALMTLISAQITQLPIAGSVGIGAIALAFSAFIIHRCQPSVAIS